MERYFRARMQDNMNFVRNVSLFSGKECARQFLPASEPAGVEATGTGSQIFFLENFRFSKVLLRIRSKIYSLTPRIIPDQKSTEFESYYSGTGYPLGSHLDCSFFSFQGYMAYLGRLKVCFLSSGGQYTSFSTPQA